MAGESAPGGKAPRARIISLKKMPKELKVALLKELGYGSDGKYVLTSDGLNYLDPFTGVKVELEKMMILPGRSPPVIIDESPLSLTEYFEEYGETF